MDKETWLFVNTFAPWLSALGTLGVVVLSLWLARRGSPILLKVRAGHRLLAGQGMDHIPEYLFIGVVNVGIRKARITGVGWKIGWLKKQHAIQMLDNNLFSSSIPVDLDESQEAQFLISLQGTNWLNSFASDFIGKWPRLNCRSLKIQVWTSVGKVFESRIESGLRQKILEAYYIANKH
jgi:hypothetical protein